MIWFFLMGMIAGAVGVVMVLRYWFRTHMHQITMEDLERELVKNKSDMESEKNE